MDDLDLIVECGVEGLRGVEAKAPSISWGWGNVIIRS